MFADEPIRIRQGSLEPAGARASMPSTEVTALYRAAVTASVRVWIAGGWCVDALVGEQTREHDDLDVAVDSDSVDTLVAVLTTKGYRYDAAETSSDWNFVMVDNVGHHIDIHVFHFDDDGQHVYGVAYPQEALQGNGVVDGQPVACITARLMLQFKTAYEPAAKDQSDIRQLQKLLFG